MRAMDAAAAFGDAALLAEPVRRRLYEYVARSTREVGRDEAARAVKIDRALAAFHLDKLVEAGFLETSFRRLSGATGPGAGRPAKLYRKSGKQLDLTLPRRQYEPLARLFAEALSRSRSPAVERELAASARRLGESIGTEARARAGPRADGDRLIRAAERTLASYGFEPRRTAPGELRLANCPFDALARDYRELVCGLNEDLMRAFVGGLGAAGVQARLDPKPGMCCVALRWKRAGGRVGQST